MLDKPEFYVHLGFRAKSLAHDAVRDGYADGVILSPVDNGVTENREIASTIKKNGGKVLFDPQFYFPRSDIEELQSHAYFNEYAGPESDYDQLGETGSFQTEDFEDSEQREGLCNRLAKFQDELGEDDSGVDAFISPARYLRSFSDANLRWWKDLTDTFQEVANEVNSEKMVLASLPLNGEMLVEDDQPGRLLNWVTGIDADGFYVTLSVDDYHDYPLTGRDTLESYLKLLWNLKETRYKVFVGHSHHVAHLYLGAGADAFSTGLYGNVRTLDMSRFDQESGDGGGRLVINYYSEPLLNDLRARSPAMTSDEDEEIDAGDLSDIDFLEAHGFDIDRIKTGTPFEAELFRPGMMASETAWSKINGEGNHYIHSCYQISRQYHEENLETDSESELTLKEKRINHTKKILTSSKDLYEEITDEEGISLTQPEPKVYSDWNRSFEVIEERVSKD